MVTVYWTEEAIEWLQNIHAYIARNNPTAAQNTVNKILEKTNLLTDFPELGGIYPIDFPATNLNRDKM